MVGCEIDRDRRSDSPLTHDSSNLSKHRRDLGTAKTAVASERRRDAPRRRAPRAGEAVRLPRRGAERVRARAAGGAPLARAARPAAEPARAGELSRRVAPSRRTGSRGVIWTIQLRPATQQSSCASKTPGTSCTKRIPVSNLVPLIPHIPLLPILNWELVFTRARPPQHTERTGPMK